MRRILRERFNACQRDGAALAVWRDLQLEILAAAKQLPVDSSAAPRSRERLWAMLGDPFWIERDPSRIAIMVDDVLALLETATDQD